MKQENQKTQFKMYIRLLIHNVYVELQLKYKVYTRRDPFSYAILINLD